MEIEISDANFEDKVIKKSEELPVVVDFWAPWCAPCNMLTPVLEKLAGEFDGEFILAKANVEQNEENARRYNIMSIPAVKMFRNGVIIAEFVGAMPEEVVRKWLSENLK